MNHSIGKKIKELRLKAGLTQEAFADLAQLHRSHMGEIERGEVEIHLSTLIKIAQALGVTTSKLVQGIRLRNDGNLKSLANVSSVTHLCSPQRFIYTESKQLKIFSVE